MPAISPLEGDRILVLGRQSGTAQLGGASFEAPLALVAETEAGLMKRLTAYPSHAEALEAAGLHDNVEIARAAYAAINRGDLEGLLALVDPDVEFRSLIAEAEGRAYRGHDGVREWWEKVAGALGGLRFEPEEIHDLGDRGYAKLVVTGTVEGVDIPQRMWQAFILRDGKPIWWATFRTEAEALEALDAG